MNEKQRGALWEYIEDCSDSDVMYLVSCIQGYNGSLEGLEWFDMCEFDTFFCDKTPLQIAQEVSEAGDAFNPDDKYFHWDSCGDLESADHIEYDKYNIEDIIDAIESIPQQHLPKDVVDILSEYEDEDDDEEDEDDV